MPRDIVVFCASPRKGGNTDLLCDAFIRGAQEAGHRADKLYLRDFPPRQHLPALIERMAGADAVVLASPVYYYAVHAQLGALLEGARGAAPRLAGKALYGMLTGAAEAPEAFDRAFQALADFAEALPGARLVGRVYGLGAVDAGDVDKAALTQAYALGHNA